MSSIPDASLRKIGRLVVLPTLPCALVALFSDSGSLSESRNVGRPLEMPRPTQDVLTDKPGKDITGAVSSVNMLTVSDADLRD
jgi:hypothetical protein